MHPDFATFSPNIGRIEWIGISEYRRQPINVQTEIDVDADGIVGDHHSKRKISLIQLEHLTVISSFLGGREVEPQELRRNLMVSGINLLALIGIEFRIDDVHLVGKSTCPPCSRMEENLGRGGYLAMVGHGGIVADVVKPGRIRVGSNVQVIERERSLEESQSTVRDQEQK